MKKKKSNYEKTQTQIVTKVKNWICDITKIERKIKNSNCDQTKSSTIIKIKKNCDKTQILKFWQNLSQISTKLNTSNWDQSQIVTKLK